MFCSLVCVCVSVCLSVCFYRLLQRKFSWAKDYSIYCVYSVSESLFSTKSSSEGDCKFYFSHTLALLHQSVRLTMARQQMQTRDYLYPGQVCVLLFHCIRLPLKLVVSLQVIGLWLDRHKQWNTTENVIFKWLFKITIFKWNLAYVIWLLKCVQRCCERKHKTQRVVFMPVLLV